MALEPVRSAALTPNIGQPGAFPLAITPGNAPAEQLRSRLPHASDEYTQPVAPSRASSPTLRSVRPLPTDAPPGAEPALWSLLEPAELAFFGVAPDITALTYARGSRSNVSAAPGRGHILDVRA